MASNASIDENDVKSLIAASSVDGSTPVKIYGDPTTHRLLIDASGATGTFVTNEVVSGSATTFTLAHTPILGSQAIYGAGIRLIPGAGNDYTIAGAVLTMTNSYSANTVLADYRY